MMESSPSEYESSPSMSSPSGSSPSTSGQRLTDDGSQGGTGRLHSSLTSHVQLEEIGPYAAAAGLSSSHFIQDEDQQLPLLQIIKCGLVLELMSFLTGGTMRLSVSAVAEILKKLSGHVDVSTKVVVAYVRSMEKKVKKIRQNEKKGKTQEISLHNLKETEFVLARERKLKEPDTPRKRRLRQALDKERAHKKSMVKKLSLSEFQVSNLKEELVAQETGTTQMKQEVAASKKQIQDLQQTIDEVSSELNLLQEQHKSVLASFEEVQAKFNPMRDELTSYKSICGIKSRELENLEQKILEANSKLSKLSTRNVTKRIQRREKKLTALKSELDKSATAVNELEEELMQTKAKLEQSRLTQGQQKESAKCDKSLIKKIWYRDVKRREQQQAPSKLQDEYEERIHTLDQRVRELEECLALCQDEKITTFADGKYTDQVRELIMELLAMNVSMSKVGKVIKATISKLTTLDIGRLPSMSTISKLIIEAKVLADIEVGLAMKKSTPESALGNVIHGDGTTKFHKKYQNFQVTLADGTSRSMGLIQVGHSDTAAVMESFKERVVDIAEELAITSHEDPDDLFKRLIVSVTSTMTDQGPTMPQFSEKIQCLREELLPAVVEKWDTLPTEVKKSVTEFGTFYCKMHPLINFAEEVNKTLKAFEDIATSGKNAHTITTSEAGVTRLVRTASKAFHHRGSDKSGMEGAFTTFISQEYSVQNHLVQYVGNRANILFEGAASTYFHQKHIVNFVQLLPDANQLILAVYEDAQEKIHMAELRALGLVHKVITEPLWHAIKTADNILSLNGTLHQLQVQLNVWKDDPSGLIRGEEAFEGSVVIKDKTYDCLMEPVDEVLLESLCIQALELICCAILIVLERQCKDNLPGGKYWQPGQVVEERFSNVPATNLIGERDFALLDMLVRQKPSARTTTLEAIVMWSNNKTVQWLDNLDPSTKQKYMDLARKHAPEVLQKYRDRLNEIQKQRWESLQEKNRAREAKETKIRSDTLKQTSDITQQGGVWVTEDRINAEYEKMVETMGNEEVRREIHKQLLFHQKVLKSNSQHREFFQLSSAVSGKRKVFTKEEMRDHLISIVQQNNFISSDPTQLASSSKGDTPAVTYTTPQTRLELFEVKKREISKRLVDERDKRAIKHSKSYLQALVDCPHKLLNKGVRHKCISPSGSPQWYEGMITKMGLAEGVNTVFTITYKEDALEPGEDVSLDFPLLKDLKKSDLIITDKLEC